MQYKLGVQCRTPSRSDRFNGVTGGAGGPKGRNRNLPWPPLQKGYIVTHSYLFTSTPQAIAKPSPGWNKVALLTAVRNSPCSCPFSVSLHPPLAALNSEPRPGSLLAFCNHHPKAVPVYGGFEPSAPGGRCSEGRIGRNREYCKRQRSKTTIFQPAFVAANVMSSRKGNGSKLPSYFTVPPQTIRLN